MTNNKIIAFFNDFVVDFLKNDSTVEDWNSEDNQSKLKKFFKKNVTKEKVSKSRKKKDPSAPKKGKSAYMFFCLEKRQSVMDEGFRKGDILKELGARWNDLKISTSKKDKELLVHLSKLSSEDKVRYEEEKETYTPSKVSESESESPTPVHKAKGVKKGKNAYHIFCAENRASLKEEYGDTKSPKEITEILSKKWKEFKSDPSNAEELEKINKKVKEVNSSEESADESSTKKTKEKTPKTPNIPKEKTPKIHKENKTKKRIVPTPSPPPSMPSTPSDYEAFDEDKDECECACHKCRHTEDCECVCDMGEDGCEC